MKVVYKKAYEARRARSTNYVKKLIKKLYYINGGTQE